MDQFHMISKKQLTAEKQTTHIHVPHVDKPSQWVPHPKSEVVRTPKEMSWDKLS